MSFDIPTGSSILNALTGQSAAEWKNLTNGSFKGITFHFAVPSQLQGHGVVSRQASLERRLQMIERPGVDGAHVADQGARAEEHTLEVIFHGPNYVADWKAFLKVLDEGTPGVLILPDRHEAVNAMFHRRTEAIDHKGGNSISCHVTWVATLDQIGSSGFASQPQIKSLADAADNAKNLVSSTTTLLQDNPFINAVRAAERGISIARSTANAVIALDQGIRNRIIQMAANITGTLALAKQAIDTIKNTFSHGIDTSPLSVQNLGVDPETGQRIADFSNPNAAIASVDPLAKPEVQASAVPTAAPVSQAGVQLFVNQAAAILTSSRDQLQSDCSGRADDVAAGITATVNALSDLAATVGNPSPVLVVVPVTMSLIEMMFQNGIPADQLNLVHQKNLGLDDLIVIPAGTVVTL